jgi:DnaJ-class molecular chaperone
MEEIEHEVFKRDKGLDIMISLRISLAEALCGFKHVIEHVDGRKLAIVITEPINNGDIRVIKHEGIPHRTRQSICGNLLIDFSVILPEALTGTQKRTIYSLLTNGENFDNVDFNINQDEIYTRADINDNNDENYDNEGRNPNGAGQECCLQ